MKITGNTAEFKIEVIGDQTGNSYLGTFTTKCILSVGDEIEADKHYRNLLGDNLLYATQEIKELAFALSQLKVRIAESAMFWSDLDDGYKCDDKNLIFELLNKSIEGQSRYLSEKRDDIEAKKAKLTKLLKTGEITEEAPETEEITGLE